MLKLIRNYTRVYFSYDESHELDLREGLKVSYHPTYSNTAFKLLVLFEYHILHACDGEQSDHDSVEDDQFGTSAHLNTMNGAECSE